MNGFPKREITESFRLERVLKSSTSGIVLRAIDPATQAAVAIKLIPCGAPAHLEANQQRFLQAMSALASLRPPAFPRLLDHGFTPDSSAFMVMDFVEGTRFDALPAAPASRLLGLVLGAVDGLERLAAAGVFHGSLAPDNLFAVTTDDKESVRILGFGTATYHAGDPPGRLELAPTVDFRAPERLDPTMAVSAPDWRSDIYSLALTTATVLHGQVSSPEDAMPRVAFPGPVKTELADAAALLAIVERALRRNPAERPTWEEFGRGLRQALSGAPAEVVAGGAATGAEVAPPAMLESAALVEPDDLQLEGAPAWLAGTGSTAPPSPPPAGEGGTMEDTNPVPPRRLTAAASEGQPMLPPSSPTWLDDGSTQRINLAERLALRDDSAPPTPAVPMPPPQPVSADTKPEFIVPSVVIPQPSLPQPIPAPVEAATERPTLAAPAAPHEGTGVLADSPPPVPVSPAPAPLAVGAAEAPLPVPTPTEGPSPEAAPAAAAQPAPAKPAARAKRTAASGRRFPLWAALAIIAVALVGGATALWFVVKGQETKAPVAPQPTRVAARPTATKAPASPTQAILQMQAAEHALTANDWAAAGEALDAITSLDQVQLTQRDLERLRGLHEAVDDLRRSALAKDLRTGLLTSNLKVLTSAIHGLTKEDEATFARNVDLNQTLEEAQRAVNLQGLMLKAQKESNWSQVLVNATSLLAILPRYAQAGEAREHAATSLEQEADALAQKGRWEQALTRLDTLGQLWSDRPGLPARVERIKAAQSADAKLATLLVSVEQTERDNAPEKGLELLRTANPGARWEERFRQARERLTVQLAALDKAPPVVALAKDAKLEYLKGKPAVVTFHITDDHAVRGARLFARVEGSDKYQELPLRQGPGGDWSAELAFAFHQNNAVELFVVASDYSDHVGQLGSAQAPLKLKRKRNWLGL